MLNVEVFGIRKNLIYFEKDVDQVSIGVEVEGVYDPFSNLQETERKRIRVAEEVVVNIILHPVTV